MDPLPHRDANATEKPHIVCLGLCHARKWSGEENDLFAPHALVTLRLQELYVRVLF
ncbi:hypothetical protein RIEGSTA812A_PEG_635 [invertebrate metagenome]|uniref:Uncharacterized protein n=1 Tax=invertebrate metagenome TaxID=1711999 RepID=A0A484HBJ3_9ZZZZ